jgi:3-deoxy-manno-octulosonate cytidylyltransferase (CMP-KDO synthetase)
MIRGKFLVQRVYEQAKRACSLSEVVVACDHEKILAACRKAGVKAILTSPDCRSGTDRVAEVARKIKGDVFLNIQGDEPMIHPGTIDQVAGLFKDRAVLMGTAVFHLKDKTDLGDPNVVKAVLAGNGDVLYFSRSAIPYQRQLVKGLVFYKHLGLYGYRRGFLMKFTALKQTDLERAESLEQLRVLENGYRIRAVVTRHDSVSIDTPQDLAKVRKLLGG